MRPVCSNSGLRIAGTRDRKYDSFSMPPGSRLTALVRSRVSGYAAAVIVPVALTYVTGRLNLPAFVFEHLVVLLVLEVALPWGTGPAVVAAIAADRRFQLHLSVDAAAAHARLGARA
jgi:hypothetical protein